MSAELHLKVDLLNREDLQKAIQALTQVLNALEPKTNEKTSKKAVEKAPVTTQEPAQDSSPVNPSEPEEVKTSEPAEPTKPEPTPAPEVKSNGVTIDQLRALLSEKVAKHRAAIKTELTNNGAANISTLAPEKFEAFHKFLSDLA
jgi:PAB1-binding protein PBP1